METWPAGKGVGGRSRSLLLEWAPDGSWFKGSLSECRAQIINRGRWFEDRERSLKASPGV